MIIELHGANFVNKGAELMLRAAVEQLSMRVPGHDFAVYPQAFGPFADRARLGLLQVMPGASRGSRSFAVAVDAAAGALPRKVNRVFSHYGLVRASKVDALVDLSGFRFSDQWGEGPALRFASLAAYHHGRGHPVILLPQSFGPFMDGPVRDAFRRIADAATLIYARDRVSLMHAERVVGSTDRLRLAPDITISFGSSEVRHDYRSGPVRRVAIVPNPRLLDKGEATWRDRYLEVLTACALTASHAGAAIQLVRHSAEEGDKRLVSELAAALRTHHPTADVECVPVLDPLRLKGLLASCTLVIASRFHALVSALASGVPAIAIGWSHKYEALMDDFGVASLQVEAAGADAAVVHVSHLMDLEVNDYVRSIIKSHGERLSHANEQMWRDVAAVLTC